ncbi:hypothetical protein V1502_01670 [Bacillus sp. SCS-153A]|uniref:hypothetical protein n=1 Tax=Rossellomorea sedimentorum TaxID=3115294 RepID=UPI003906CA67
MRKRNGTERQGQPGKEEEIEKIEKQIAAALWLQSIGQVAEAILVLKLLLLKEESEGEKKTAVGIWIQTIGQIIETVGVTRQLGSLDRITLKEAQRGAIIGDILQSAGAAIEVLGGKQILIEDDGFVP